MKNHSLRTAFTLLELVVVLAILSVVTALAVRALDRVDDQRRYEASQRGLEEISMAVLGSPDDRDTGGARTISGFLADLGRLPKTGLTDVTLRELWEKPDTEVRYDLVRAALSNLGNSANPNDEDLDVLVGVGWRGPYLHLPMNAPTLLDGWGNPITSLWTPTNQPITAPEQTVGGLQLAGANGIFNPEDKGYDKDLRLEFSAAQYEASLWVQVDVMNGPLPAAIESSHQIAIRVFSPDPSHPGKIAVISTPAPLPFSNNPVTFNFPVARGLTIGPRVVRAYFTDSVTNLVKKSVVKHVTLRPGVNFVNLTIDR